VCGQYIQHATTVVILTVSDVGCQTQVYLATDRHVLGVISITAFSVAVRVKNRLEMWANAQRDGRPAEYRWRPLFKAAVWLCSNAAKKRNPLKFAGMPQTNDMISAAIGPKFTIL